MAILLESLRLSANGLILPPPEDRILKPKLDFWPTLSIKFGRLHFWFGKTRTHDRLVFAVAELKEEFSIGFTFHWLADETPMFSLLLWPAFFGTLFWCYPGKKL